MWNPCRVCLSIRKNIFAVDNSEAGKELQVSCHRFDHRRIVVEMVQSNLTRFPVKAMQRGSVRGPSRVAPVRVHAGHAALCDVEDAAAQADRMTFAKVASRSVQHFIDVGST